MKTINSYIASFAIALLLILSMLGIGLDAMAANTASAGTNSSAQVTTAQALQDLEQR